jgi:hypothetical protein
MEPVVVVVGTRCPGLLQREFVIQWRSRRFGVELGCSHFVVGMTALHWYLGRSPGGIALLRIAVLGFPHTD